MVVGDVECAGGDGAGDVLMDVVGMGEMEVVERTVWRWCFGVWMKKVVRVEAGAEGVEVEDVEDVVGMQKRLGVCVVVGSVDKDVGWFAEDKADDAFVSAV